MKEVVPIRAWQCIGCGRLDGPQPCVGICEDRPVLLVTGEEYWELQQAHDQLQEQLRALRDQVRGWLAVNSKPGREKDCLDHLHQAMRKTLDAAG